jgi:hypothetical protein
VGAARIWWPIGRDASLRLCASAKSRESEKEKDGEEENLVLRLLSCTLGGEDLMSISQMITLNMESPWMDDMTIIVQAL